MTKNKISDGTAHKIPEDLKNALAYSTGALTVWEGLTPLARNEWICWVISAKRDETRKEHMKRTISELREGKRRPCCWIGCIHRTDKMVSPSIKAILARQSKKSKK